MQLSEISSRFPSSSEIESREHLSNYDHNNKFITFSIGLKISVSVLVRLYNKQETCTGKVKEERKVQFHQVFYSFNQKNMLFHSLTNYFLVKNEGKSRENFLYQLEIQSKIHRVLSKYKKR